MEQTRVLVVEDDLSIGNVLEELLKKAGYAVLRAYSGTEALLVLEKQKQVDLILLDLMLPGIPGEQVLAQISHIPVIVLSAKAGTDDKVDLLLAGAADYVTKPFEPRELLARIAVALRKRQGAQAQTLVFEEICLDLDTRSARVGEQAVHLTRTEYAILAVLMENPKQVVTKSALLERISDLTPDCTENTLKMHVSNLRRKLRDAGREEAIEAVWGIGFRMKGREG